MENTIKVAIESFTRHNLPVPDGLTNWCVEHSREDLLAAESDNFLPSAEEFASLLGVNLPADFVVESAEKPASESEISALIDLAIEQMARDFGVNMHEK
ncbi:MAG: hypothetical protein STSR0001_13550 [Methanothrix sp.]